MNVLVIETATERAVIALADIEGKKVFREERLPVGLRSSDHLVPLVETLLQAQGWSASDLDAVVVGVGPGSYTGVRVGVAVAKAIVFAHQLPLVAVSSLCGFVPEQSGVFAAVVDARIGGAYVQKGESVQGAALFHGAPQLCPPEQLPAFLSGVQTVVTPHATPLQRRFREVLELCSVSECWPDSEAILAQAARCYSSGEYSEDGSCQILYLRKTQAEMEQQNKKG